MKNYIKRDKMYKLIIIIFTLISLSGCSKEGKEIITSTGLKYTDIKEGNGPSAANGKMVSILYTGTFPDGRVFDSALDKNQPLKFTLGSGEMIPGFEEGVMTMKVGGRRKLVIPPNLGWAQKARVELSRQMP